MYIFQKQLPALTKSHIHKEIILQKYIKANREKLLDYELSPNINDTAGFQPLGKSYAQTREL